MPTLSSPSTAAPKAFSEHHADALAQWGTPPHILASADFSPITLAAILHLAQMAKTQTTNPKHPWQPLAGHTVATAFFEPSTRTRLSFETAAQRLGANILTLTAQTSSTTKGESEQDTLQTLHALAATHPCKPVAAIIRHTQSGIVAQLAATLRSDVLLPHPPLRLINGGDGQHDHPSQGLLDAYTLIDHWQLWNTLDADPGTALAGKRIAIVGDILHSRVARSNAHFLTQLGASVVLSGPPALLPPAMAGLGVSHNPVHVTHSLAEALTGADAVMALRLQQERQANGLIASLAEYHQQYGITTANIEQYAHPQAIFLHPGPMNRGVEVDSTLADDPNRSLVLHQVANGVAVRMALLMLALLPAETLKDLTHVG